MALIIVIVTVVLVITVADEKESIIIPIISHT